MRGATIVFDLDGTLVDTAPDLTAALNHVLDAHGVPRVELDTIRRFVGLGARRMIEEGLARHAAGNGLDADDLLPRFLDYYAAHIADESQPFDGAVAALDALSEAGAQLAILTNKREGLSRRLLSALDLDERFAQIVGRDTLSVCKPDPTALLTTIERAGGRADCAVMIGDSITDIATAKAAEVPVVAVSFGYADEAVETYSPTRVIDHFGQLEETLRHLLDGCCETTSARKQP
jgi:phosphoglycolate phosphatase